MSGPRTLIEFLHAARDYLAAKGVDNPRGDAEALLGKVLALPRLQLYLQHDRPLKPDEIAGYRELLARRGRREPLQLILGTVEFCGLPIAVRPGLLIPRPETEELALAVIGWMRSNSVGDTRVLDIGTGTGCLAVAIADGIPGSRVDAVDIDFESVRCATANAAANGVAGRVRTLTADVLSERFAEAVEPLYDVVVSNPPYIAEAEFPALAPEVREHESRWALLAGADGLRYYRRLAVLAPGLLRPGGLLAVEVGFGQAADVQGMLAPGFSGISVRNDLAGLPRVILGIWTPEQETSPLPVS